MENQKTLALVMIVKNEAKGLEKAVLSAKSICDEIFISVDNASTDETAQIALRLTPNVKFYDWSDDFSAMRNFAHSGVKSDWILYLDGHEILANPENVKKYLDSADDGLLCRVKMENNCYFPSPRIYRNGCKFAGPIHEQLDCKTTTQADDIIIEHHRVDLQEERSAAEREVQRNDQSERLLGGQLKKDSKNTRAAFHLALFYGSKRDWKNALKYQKIYLKHADKVGGRWYVYYNMAIAFYEQKKYFRAWMATCSAVKENPYRWEISDLRGLIFYRQKNWQKAAEYFVESFNDNHGDVSFLPKEKNVSMIWNFIGECLFQQAEYWRASEAFMAAFKNCKDADFKKLLERRCALMQDMAKKIKPDLK